MLARKTLLDGVVLAGPYKLPLRQPHERLQLAVLRQYKDLLVQTKFLFDENARKYVAERIRQRFRDNMLPQGSQRIKSLLTAGRRWLSILERANLGDIKAIEVILKHTYARIGRRKHEIIHNLAGDKSLSPRLDRWRSFLANKRNISDAKLDLALGKYSQYHRIGQPRAPPDIPPAVKALMSKDPNVGHLLDLASRSPSRDKAIPLKRQVNAAWKHYQTTRSKLSAPLPREEIEFLVRMATHGPDKPSVRTDFLMKIEERRKAERKATGQFRGCFHRIDQSFIRRRYQDLLTRHYFPTLEPVGEGGWRVGSVSEMFPRMFKRIPDMDPRHMQGFMAKGGRNVGAVDASGKFVNPRGL